jgi:hypothetical protein
VLGTGHAAVSAYWLTGGTALLDTIGESLEEWVRDRSATAAAAVAAVVVVKLVTAALGPLVAAAARPVHPGGSPAPPAGGSCARWRGSRRRSSCCTAACSLRWAWRSRRGIVSTAADADERALAWHAWLGDPWFLAWGPALTATLWWTRPARA